MTTTRPGTQSAGGGSRSAASRSDPPVGRRVDVRLALGAGAAWLALAWAAGREVRTIVAVAVLVGLVGVAATAAVWCSRADPVPGSVWAALALVAWCVVLVLAPFAARTAHARGSPLQRFAAAGADVSAELTVTGDPHVLAATGPSGAPRVAVPADASAVVAAGQRWSTSGAVLALGDAAAWADVLPGQRVRVDGELAPPLDATSSTVALFARAPPELVGAPPWWQRAAGAVRAGLRSASSGLPQPERGLLPGLVDGDTAGLDPVMVERFRIAGLTHLVAVSGTNCSIVVGAVLLVLRRARVRPWCCALVGALVLVAFVLVARPSPSVLRAALMAAVALVSLATGRPRQAVPALAGAALALLVWDPALALDVGFAMSVLATGALLVLAPGWADALRRRRVPVGIAEAVAIAAAAHLVTAPIVAAISGRVSVVAIPANVLAEPVVAPATLLGFLAAAFGTWAAPLARGCAQAAGWPCRWLVGVADHLGALPGAALPWPTGMRGGLLLLGVSALLWALVRRVGIARPVVAGLVVAAFVQIPVRVVVSGWPPPGWVMVACDIGQGDAIVLDAGDGSAVEIDTGPDPVAVDECLRDLHVDALAVLVLTHFHLDHVGGIVGALHDRAVGRVLVGPLPDPAGGVALVQSALAGRGVQPSTPPVGTTITAGAVRLDVLGPAAAMHGTRSDPNNSSLVLRATVHGVRILLPGDAEVEEQRAILASGADLRADVLKVPHHGSAYSDLDFLAAVHAELGVISVGAHNDYGHPAPLLLSELAGLGVPVRRTDQDGDVAVVRTDSGLASVVRGTHRVSAAGAPPTRATSVGSDAATSVPDAWMDPLLPAEHVLSASTSCPSRRHRWWCSSATRSCSSPAPSARSPPRCAAPRRALLARH